MNSFSPSLVLAAWNFGDNIVPNTKAVIGIQNPVKLVNLATKYWIEINKIAKQPNWYRKARTCNFVIFLMFYWKLIIVHYHPLFETSFSCFLHTFRISPISLRCWHWKVWFFAKVLLETDYCTLSSVVWNFVLLLPSYISYFTNLASMLALKSLIFREGFNPTNFKASRFPVINQALVPG